MSNINCQMKNVRYQTTHVKSLPQMSMVNVNISVNVNAIVNANVNVKCVVFCVLGQSV